MEIILVYSHQHIMTLVYTSENVMINDLFTPMNVKFTQVTSYIMTGVYALHKGIQWYKWM